MISDTNISMIRGDTMSFGLEIEGLEKDLETAYFTARQSPLAEHIVFQKSLGFGITKDEFGKYVVRVAPEDTRNVEAGNYYYDFQIGVNGDIFTLLIGTLTIEQDATF